MTTPGGTRERLLAAAVALAERGGEAAVRVDAVAEAAGVKRPSVYHFFGDRDGLVIAAQAERYRASLLFEMNEQIEITAAITSRLEFIDYVRRRMAHLASPDGVERRRVRVETLGSAATRPALRALLEQADAEAAQMLGRLLAIVQERGWIAPRFDLEVAALWWFGLMNTRFLVEGTASTLVRREWDAIAVESVLVLLFGTTPDTD